MRVGEQDFPPKKLHTREQAFPDLAAGDGCNAPQAAKESQTLPDESEDLEGSLRALTTPVQHPLSTQHLQHCHSEDHREPESHPSGSRTTYSHGSWLAFVSVIGYLYMCT